MTGRDLIIHILQNGLEDEQVFNFGVLLGFITPEDPAKKFNVGLATINAWVEMGLLNSIKIGESIFIPADEKSPSERSLNGQ